MAEYPFAKCPGQRWRFDFAWPGSTLAVHVDGGVWVPCGGRHTRGAVFAADHDKMNRATLPGWRVLRFMSRHLADGSALADLAEALGNQPITRNGPAHGIWLSVQVVPMNRRPGLRRNLGSHCPGSQRLWDKSWPT